MANSNSEVIEGRGIVGMIEIPSGVFTMGSEAFYPEERPLRRVCVERFRIDVTPVTNRQFAEFVKDAGYVTVAEIAPSIADYPGMDPSLAQPGSLVFRRPTEPVSLRDWSQWWEFCLGADWRHPTGPESSIERLADHPVVHIAYSDAVAYAKWAGKSLPTEAEFEYAARGGHDDRAYSWGDELTPGGRYLANFWQGQFPSENSLEDGWERTSPVRYYPPNDFGVHDMIGNVWEWTCDDDEALKRSEKHKTPSCCPSSSSLTDDVQDCRSSLSHTAAIGSKIIKGGSHLCAENYCQRYRPAARQVQSVDTSASHIGFRCVQRLGAPVS